jgi:hypothetical protein
MVSSASSCGRAAGAVCLLLCRPLGRPDATSASIVAVSLPSVASLGAAPLPCFTWVEACTVAGGWLRYGAGGRGGGGTDEE